MLNRKISRVSRLKVGAMLAVAVMGITGIATNIIQPAHGATINKNNVNSVSANDLSLGAAWVGGGAPTSLDTANFGSPIQAGPFVLGSNATWNGLTLTSPTSNVTINNNGTNLSALGLVNGISIVGKDLTINVGSVTLTGSQSWNTATSTTLAVSSNVLVGSNVLTLDGLGTTVLSGNVTGGTTIVNGGTVTLAGSYTTSANTTVLQINAGRLNLNSSGTVGSLLSIFGGTIGNTRVVATGTTGDAAVRGSVNITAPWLINGSFSFAGPGFLDLTGGGTLTTSASMNISDAVATIRGGATFTSGPNALYKTGDGTLILGTVNNWNGGSLVLQEGTLWFGNASAVGTSSAATAGVLVLNGGHIAPLNSTNVTGQGNQVTLNANVRWQVNGAVDIANTWNAPMWVGGNAGSNWTISGQFSGAGTLSYNQLNSITFNGTAGTNTFTGGLVINGGAFTLTFPAALASNVMSPDVNLVVGGQTWTTTFAAGAASKSQTFNNAVRVQPGNSTWTFTNNGTGSNTGQVNFAGGITREAGATVVITNAPSATNSIALSALPAGSANGVIGWMVGGGNFLKLTGGTLGLLAAADYSNTWNSTTNTDMTGNVVVSGGDTGSLRWANNSANSYSLTLAGGLNTILSGGIFISGANNGSNNQMITGPGQLTSGNGQDLIIFNNNTAGVGGMVISSEITGAIGVTKSGAGSLNLTAANTYTKPTYVVQGLLRVTQASALGTSNTLVLNGGGQLRSEDNLNLANLTFYGGGAVNNSVNSNVSIAAGKVLNITTLVGTAYHGGNLAFSGGGTVNIANFTGVTMNGFQFQGVNINLTNNTATNVSLTSNSVRANSGLTNFNLNPGAGSITLDFGGQDGTGGGNNMMGALMRISSTDLSKVFVYQKDGTAIGGVVVQGGNSFGAFFTIGNDFAVRDLTQTQLLPLASLDPSLVTAYNNVNLGTAPDLTTRANLNISGAGTATVISNDTMAAVNGITLTSNAWRFVDATGGQTVDLQASVTLDGIMVAPSVGANVVTIQSSDTANAIRPWGAGNGRAGGSNDAGGVTLWQNNPSGTLVLDARYSNVNLGAALIKAGPGLVVMTSTGNDYGSHLYIDEGGLQINSQSVLSSAATSNIVLLGGKFVAGGTYALQTPNGASNKLIQLGEGGGTVEVLGSNTLTASGGLSNYVVPGGANAGYTQFGGPLTKSGTGTFVVPAGVTTSITGTVTVNGGLLVVNQSTTGVGTGSVIVNSGGTLGGIGRLFGSTVTVATGGGVAPGDPGLGGGIGTLTMMSTVTTNGVSSLVMGANSVLAIDLTVASNDRVVLPVSGSLTVTGPILVNLYQAGSTAVYRNNGTYTLLTGFSGNYPGLASSFQAANALTPANYSFNVVSNGTVNSLTVTIVNELNVSIWNGSVNGSWATGGNWTGGTPDAIGDTAFFGPAGNAAAPVLLDAPLNGGRRVANLLFDNGSGGGYTINVGTPGTSKLILDNASLSTLVSVSGTSHVINSDIQFVAGSNVSFSNGSSLTLNGIVSNSATGSKWIAVSGNGTLIVTNNANTWTGNVSLTLGGGLQLGDGLGGTTGALTSPTITLSGGNLINGRSDVTLVSQLPTFSGSGILTQNSPSTLLIDSSLGNFTGTLAVRNGTMSQSAPLTGGKGLALLGGTFDMNDFNGTFSSISGTSFLANSGVTPVTALVQLNGNTTFSGAFLSPNGGTVTLAIPTSVGAPKTLTLNGNTGPSGGAGIIQAQSGGTLLGTTFIMVTNSSAVHPDTIIQLDEVYGLTANGGGTTMLQIADGVNLNANVVIANLANSGGSWRHRQEALGLPPVGGISATFSGRLWTIGSIPDANSGFRIGAGVVESAASTTISTLTITGSISGTNSATLPLSFLNDSGNIIFNNATVNANTSNIYLGQLRSNDTGSIMVTGASSIFTTGASGADTIFLNLNINGGTAAFFPGTQTGTTMNYVIDGTSVINAGAGTINFNAANAASNASSITLGGSARIVAGGFRASSTTAVSTFVIDGGTIAAATGGGGIWVHADTLSVRLGAGGLFLDSSSANLTVNQNIISNLTSGLDGGLTILGNPNGISTVTIGGTGNAYTGSTKIMTATLQASANNVLPTGTVVTLLANNSLSRLDTTGTLQTIGGLDSNGTASSVIGTGTLTINVAPNTSYTYAGSYTAASLFKAGLGTQNIVGATSISGDISTAGGLLNFGRADLPSVTIVASGTGGAFSSNGGDGTIQLTLGNSGAAVLQVGIDTIARTNGGTINFVIDGGTNPDTARIVLANATATHFINSGVFFNGADYAVTDTSQATANGFLRAMNYASDPDTGTAITSLIPDVHNLASSAVTSGNISILTLKMGAGSGLTQDGGSTLVFANGGLVKSGSDSSTISGANIQFTGDPVIRVDTGSNLVINSNILANGSQSAAKVGAGILTLGGTNTFFGKMNINGGSVTLSSASALPNAVVVLSYQGSTESSLLFGSGITATTIGGLASSPFSGAANLDLRNADTNAVALTLATATELGTSQFYDGIISGTGSIIMNSTGVEFRLGKQNTFSGGLTLTNGTVVNAQASFVSGSTDTSFGTGGIIFNGGKLQLRNNTNVILNNALTVNASTTSSIDLNGNSNATFTNNLTGTGTLVRTGGTGTLLFSGTNSGFSGTFTNEIGSVAFTTPGAVGTVYNFNNTSGTETFFVNSTVATTLTLSMITGATGNTLTVTNSATSGTRSTLLVIGTDGAAGTGSFGGAINNGSNGISVQKVGTGTLTLSGNSAFAQTSSFFGSAAALNVSNGTIISRSNNGLGGGAVALGNASNSANSASILLGNVTTAAAQSLIILAGTAGEMTFGVLAGSTANFAGNMTINRNVSIVALDTASTLRLGGLITGNTAITGTRNMTISGGGTVLMNGSSLALYTGNVIVSGTVGSAGTRLLFTGSTTSAVSTFTIGSGATLGGTGTINGAIVVQSGGHVAPGLSIGTLNLASSSVNFQAGSLIDFELVDPATQGDVLRGGTVTFSGATTLNLFNLNATSSFITNGSYSIMTLGTLPSIANLSVAPLGGANAVLSTSTVGGNQVIVTISNGITYGLWSNNDTNSAMVWGTGANWVAGLIPNGSSNTADFRNVLNSAATRTVTLDGSKTVSVIKFNNTIGSYILTSTGSSDITLVAGTGSNAAILSQTATTNTIDAPLNLNTTTLINAVANARLITNNVTASGNLTVSGAGSLVVGGTLNLLAGATVSAGANLVLGTGAASGTFAGTIRNLGTLAYNRNDVFSVDPSNIDGSGTGILANNHSSSIMILTSASLMSGSLRLTGGTVRLGTADVIGNATPVNVTSGGTLDLNGQLSNWTPTPATFTFAGAIGNSSGSSSLTLGASITGGANTYAGKIMDLGGELTLRIVAAGSVAAATTFNAIQNFTQGSTFISVLSQLPNTTIGHLTLGAAGQNYLGRSITLEGYGAYTQNTNGAIQLNNGVILGNGTLSELVMGTAVFHGEVFTVLTGNNRATFGGNIGFTGSPNPDAELRLGISTNSTIVYTGAITVPEAVNLAGNFQINRGTITLDNNGSITLPDSSSVSSANLLVIGQGGQNGNNNTLLFTMSGNSSISTNGTAGSNAIGLAASGLTSGTVTMSLTGNALVTAGIGGLGRFDLNNNGAAEWQQLAPNGTINTARVILNIAGNSTIRTSAFTRTAAVFVPGTGTMTQGTVVNFNGGTIVATGPDGTDLIPASLTPAVVVRPNGGTIDLNGKLVVITHPLTTPANGTNLANQTDGGLIFKSSVSTGTINLTGAQNTYRGPTVAGTGALVLVTSNKDLGNMAGGALTFDGGTVKLMADLALNNSQHNAGTAGVLTHRYTFNAFDAVDSVGGVDGSVIGSTTFENDPLGNPSVRVHGEANAGGGIKLDNGGLDPDASAINIKSYQQATIVVWFTKATTNTAPTGLFAFGGTNLNASVNGYQYLMAQANGGGGVRSSMSNAGNDVNIAGGNNVGANGETAIADATSTNVGEHQMAVTIDANNITIYLDGVFKVTQNLRNDYGGNVLAGLTNALAYIGTSVDHRISSFNGFIDEFRIYNSALTLNDIAAINNNPGTTGNFTPNNNLAASGLTSRNLAIGGQGGTLQLDLYNMSISGNITGVAVANATSSAGTLNVVGAGKTVVFTGNMIAATAGTNNSVGKISLGAGVTMRVGTGGSTGNLTAGSVTLSDVTSSLIIDKTSASTFGAGIAGVGSVSHVNTGTTTLSGLYTATGSMTVSDGKLAFADTAAPRQTAAVLLTASSLSVAGGKTLDLGNHDMLIHSGSTAAFEAQIGAAYNFGLFDLPGITSATAGASGGLTTLGINSGDDYNNFGTSPGLFDGSAVVSGDTVIKYTYTGDLNLDGIVDDNDLFQFLGTYLGSQVGNYAFGDINYDGVVDDNDLFPFLGAYLNPPTPQLGGLGGGSVVPSLGGAGAAVPEPATLALLGMGAAVLLTKRRKKS